ncbi:uncharacterized protein LOC135154217 [Lytechinus pictus]|uniref:uncharacterized protein LOC135154217 n=1 Tax=Lytechinus pictus TaxID=7653 RepID=UPI0030B9EFC7
MDSGVCKCTDPCWHGVSCHDLCSGQGFCTQEGNSHCECQPSYWGEFCEIASCHGDGRPCSGHGVCQPDRTCMCESSWLGQGCELPVCINDCNGYGFCDGSSGIPVCQCDENHFGLDCGYDCVNGTVFNETCVCDPCSSGPFCDQECAGHGICMDDTCHCDQAWWGTDCSYRGCPGDGTNCTGHGYCDALRQQCSCMLGWKDQGCNVPDCIGEPDCGGRGYCNGSYDPLPQCDCYNGWIGEACEVPCINGTQDPLDPNRCICHHCFGGLSCDVECNNRGSCSESEGCACDPFFKGELCNEFDCPGEPDCSDRGSCLFRDGEAFCLCDPGFTSENCSELVCPGQPQCSGFGTCTLIDDTPLCICQHGFDGDACQTCRPRFTGDTCDRCIEGYIGYNTSCSIYCLHGYASDPGGDECQCYDDDEHGHWSGQSCLQCKNGFALPDCQQCERNYVGDCSISCIEGQGTYSDPMDGLGGEGALQPFLQCLTPQNETSDGIAWFGYRNLNTHNVYLPIGPANHFDFDDYGGQPTKFKPGLHYSSVRITFNDKVSATWFLSYSPSNSQFRETASEANSTVRLCTSRDEEIALENQLESANDSHCICNHGYWGPACQNECIGGSDNPCFGNGICNSNSGLCHCEDSVDQMSANCTLCSEGRFGIDCSVASSSLIEDVNGMRYAAAYGPGHFTTFDGSSYTYRGEGEHYLINSSIELQVRLVPCRQGKPATCINAVAFSAGNGRIVAIHGGYTDNDVQFVTWIDGEEQSIDSDLLGNGFLITRLSYDHFLISKDDFMDISVYIRGRYISVFVKTTGAACSELHGLLSSCNGNPYDDFVLSNGNHLYLDRISSYSLSQDSIHHIFGPSWKVRDSSLLSSIYLHGNYQQVYDIEGSDAGYAMFFEDSSLKSTSPINSFTGPDVTFELDLKLAEVSQECKAVFSYYLSDTSGLLLCDGYLTISVETSQVATFNIKLEVDTWYQISILWLQSVKRLQVYAISDSTFQSDVFVVDGSLSNFLDPGGILVFGQWQLPSGYSGPFLYRGFSGWLDEIKIWNSYYFENDVRSHYGVTADMSDSALSSYFVLNEGQGSVIKDSKSIMTLMILPEIWNPPRWQFSSATVHRSTVATLRSIYYPSWSNQLAHDEAAVLCSRIISDTPLSPFSVCSDLEMVEYYAYLCSADSALHDTSSYSMEVILAYSQHCRSILNLMQSPEQSYCNDFPGRRFPDWTGPGCNIPCKSGVGPSSCSCYSGYWGEACEHSCPGGDGSLACGGVGVCLSDNGTCDCPLSFDSSSDCSSCTPGWSGLDCSVTTVNSTNILQPVCAMFGFGHIITFDGLSLSLDIPGEYQLASVGDIDVYIRHTPSPWFDLSCSITSVWLKLSDTSLTFQASFSDEGSVRVYLDDDLLTPSGDMTLPSGHILLISYDGYIVHDNQTTVAIISHLTYFDIQVTTRFEICRNSSRPLISGNCDSDPSNDLRISKDEFIDPVDITYEKVNGPWAKYIRLAPESSTKFVYHHPNRIDAQDLTPGGYGLYFNDSSCISDQLQDDIFSVEEDMTIELLFFPIGSTSGCLFSYLNGNSFFALTIDITLQIYVSTSLNIDTGIIIHPDHWNFLSFVYHRESGGCTIVYVGKNTISGWSFIVGRGYFFPGGSVAVGTWQSSDYEYPYETGYHGYIDELRIWKRNFDITTTWSNTNLNIQAGIPGLVALWKFDEGNGVKAVDIVSLTQLQFSSDRGPFFALCGAPIDSIPKSFHYFEVYDRYPSSESRKEALDICTEVVLDKYLIDGCSQLGRSVSLFFLQNCFYDSSHMSDNQLAYVNARIYSAYCGSVLDLEVSPKMELCDKARGNPDVFLALGCTDIGSCKFGYFDVATAECVCLEGYWGSYCSNICPGGHENPCNRKGYCDKYTGVCHCPLTWSSESNCTKCESAWSGENCDVALPVPDIETNNKTCGVFGQGHILNFDGAYFDFKEFGEYVLLFDKDSSFSIQARIIPCYNFSSCVSAVAVSNSSHTFIIRSGYTSQSKPLFWFAGEQIELNNLEETVGHVVVRHMSNFEYHLIALDQTWTAQIRIVDRYLNILINMARECTALSGICGSCDNNVTNDIFPVHEGKLLWQNRGRSLFSPLFESTSYNELEVSVGSGYTLTFDDTFLQSENLDLDLQGSVSFELYFRTKTNHGVLMSFGARRTFSMYLDTTLQIIVGTAHFDTNVVPFIDWNHLVLVIKPSDQQDVFSLRLALIDSDGLTKTWEITITENIFVSSFYIVFGQWLPGEDTYIPSPVSRPFRGSIDEFYIWKKELLVTEVLARLGSSVLPGPADLVALWKFDEGQGNTATDLVNQKQFMIRQYSWNVRTPIWQFSSAPISLYSPTYILHNPSEWFQSCVELFATISSTCHSVSDQIDVYLVACARDYALSNSEYARLGVLLSYADVCHLNSESTLSWPAQDLCNSFDVYFPLWYGPSCESKCYFSLDTDSPISNCTCSPGTWGIECDSSCVGGVGSHCNGHGTCSPASGSCQCESNWMGSSCDVCSQGWFGSDCSLTASRTPDIPLSRCSMYINGHITMFDGSVFEFSDTSDMVFFSSSDIEIQIRQIPCNGLPSCITAVSFATGTSHMLLSAPHLQQSDPVILLNNVTLPLETELFVGSTGFSLIRVAVGHFEINGPNNFKFKILSPGAYFNLEVLQTNCIFSSGLCGPCQVMATSCGDSQALCAINNLGFVAYASLYPLSFSLSQQYGASYVRYGPSSLIYTQLLAASQATYIPVFGSPSGYALQFYEDGIMSDPLPSFFSAGRTTTLQWYCKFTDIPGGTLFSASESKSLAVTVGDDGNFWIHAGFESQTTGIIAPQNDWLFIMVSYSSDDGQIVFYCVKSSGAVYKASLNFSFRVQLISPGVVLGIGSWVLPSTGSVPLPRMQFHGMIDNLIITKDSFVTLNEVLVAWKQQFSPGDPSVVLYLTFDKGTGAKFYDAASSIPWNIPQSLHRKPSWVVSDLPIVPQPGREIFTLQVSFSDETLEKDALAICREQIYDGPVDQACGSLSESAQYHYQACLSIIASSGRLRLSLDATLDFSSGCQEVLHLPSSPAQQLCNAFTDTFSWPYAGSTCSERCVFGYFTDHCICDRGYYGAQCDQTCPGGPNNPCNAHGSCNPVTGHCMCEPNWESGTDCTTCSEGYVGEDCSIGIVPQPPSTTSISVVWPDTITTYAGLQVPLMSFGIFIISDATAPGFRFYCHVNLIPSPQGFVILLITFSHNDVRIRFHLDRRTQEVNTVVGGFLTQIDDVITRTDSHGNTITINHPSPDHYEVECATGLTLMVMVSDGTLGAEIKLSRGACCLGGPSWGGLAGFCHCSHRIIKPTHFFNETDSNSDITKKTLEWMTTDDVSSGNDSFEYVLPGGFAGFSIKLNNSLVYVDSVAAFVSNAITISINVKFCGPACGGVIFAYAGASTFLVSVETFVTLHVDDILYSTDLQPAIGNWTQVSLLYDRSNLVLQVYLHDFSGYAAWRSIHLDTDVFEPLGSLALGNWFPGSSYPNLGIFHGDIDEFTVWDRFLDEAELRALLRASPLSCTPNLVAQWRFDSLNGDMILDSVSDVPMHLSSPGYQSPELVTSDLELDVPGSGIPPGEDSALNLQGTVVTDGNGFDVIDPCGQETSVGSWIEVFCSDIIYSGPLGQECQLGQSASLDVYVECVKALENTNSTEAALPIIIRYADFCQATLLLSFWPAQTLCNRFGDAPFPLWIGDDCDIQCVYGNKDLNDRNICLCDAGHWNVSCDKVCPGGSNNPCNGIGVCNRLTGHCDCPVNWQGAPDCSVCTPGWTGAGCALSKMPIGLGERISSIGLSFITTYNGFTFQFTHIGEYQLLVIGHHQFGLQAKFVNCFTQKSCMQHLGFYFGDNVNGYGSVTISAGEHPKDFMSVRLNGRSYDLHTNVTFGNAGYVFRRLSLTEILCTGPDGLRLTVRSSGLYITLQTELPEILCAVSQGLLAGGCCNSSSNSTSPFTIPMQPLKCPGISGLEINPAPLNDSDYTYITDDSIPACQDGQGTRSSNFNDLLHAWLINNCESVISYRSLLIQHQQQIDFNLQLNPSVLFVKELISIAPVKYDVTFELFVKLLDPYGVILSFSHSSTFSLYVNGTLHINLGGIVYTTSLRLQLQAWYKIVVVFTASSNNHVNIYLVTSTQDVFRETIDLLHHPDFFKQAGYLALGSWLPSSNDVGVSSLPGLRGHIDDLRIWNRAFTPGDVATLWTTIIPDDAEFLTAFWPLDEGQGDVAVDIVQGICFHMPDEPWSPSVWVTSDIINPSQSVPLPDSHLNASINVCSRLFFTDPLHGACQPFLGPTTASYHDLCLQAADDAGEGGAYNVAFAYADICQTILNLTSWPAQPLCKEVPHLRAGSQCKGDCVNGVEVSDVCYCHEGFFGNHCELVCPGGFVKPCSNHGVCDPQGQCRCEQNWQGSVDCSTCSGNWEGIDCTLVHTSVLVASQGGHRINYNALISVHTQYITFDGLTFYFGAVGEFYLVRTQSFRLQIRQVPCFTEGTCVAAFAVFSDEEQIVFHAPYNSGDVPILWLNHRIIHISQIETMITQHWLLHELQQGKYKLTFLEEGYSVDIQVIRRHLQLSISLPQQTCQDSEGLLGNCNGDVSDDFRGPLNSTTQQDINGEIADSWRVPINESYFVHSYGPYIEMPIPSGAIYSLRVDHTGAVTTPTNFTIRNATLIESITINFRIKVLADEGVIISLNFGRTVTMYLVGSHLRIYDSLLHYDTAIVLAENLWIQIYFVITANGTIRLYAFTDTGISNSYTTNIASFPSFMDDFYISIGQHIIQPTENNILLLSSFVGDIDDLRLWSRQFHPALIDQGRTVNLFANVDQEFLIGLYRFDFSSSSHMDDVQRINLLSPHDPWPSPWTIPSDANVDISIADPFARTFNNKSLAADAVDICSFLDPNSNVSTWDLCSNSTEAFQGFFHLSCLRTVSTSRSTDAAFALMSSVLDYCATLNGENVSYDGLCFMLRNKRLPNWLLDLCDASCIYGTPDADGKCSCHSGFWGVSCSFDCPGGHSHPCNDNGQCLREGICECLPNWSGDECNQCNHGWSGEDCSLGIARIGNSLEVNTQNAYFSMHGRIVTFDGASIFLRKGYTYNILSGIHLDHQFKLKLRLSDCVNAHGFTLCYDAISVSYHFHTITMNVNTNFRFGVDVWINHHLIALDHITQITENFIITRLNIIQYEISLSSTIRIIVTVHEKELEIQVIAPTEYCMIEGLSGLLSSCNTPGELSDTSCTLSRNGSTSSNQSSSNCSFNGTQSSIDNYTSRFIAQEIYNSEYESHLNLLPTQGAGYFLFFKDSIVVSAEMWNFPTELFTLEMYVLPLSVDGVLLSYGTSQGIFALLLSNTSLQVSYGTALYDLDLYVELDVWQQITLVWHQSTLILEIYLFDLQGSIRVNAIQFQSAIFHLGGHLALGQWYAHVPFDAPALPAVPFEGGLDEIRLWTRRTNPSVVRSSWKFNADVNTPDLTNLWKMNSGVGDTIVDVIGDYNLKPVDTHLASWQISEDIYTSRNILPFIFPVFRTANLSDLAHTLCHQIFLQGQLFENCQELDDIFFSKYHTQCLYDISFQSDVNAAIQATIAFADICFHELTLTSWPAQYLCNTFQDRDFPYWIGSECDIPCLFGKRNDTNSDICECEVGYWKDDCSSPCPGGIINPCSGHGLCDKQTGHCSCDIHWLGKVSDMEYYPCNECSEGWIGTDCSTTTIYHNLTDTRNEAVAIFSSGAHVTMFDGASLQFDIPGLFSLLSTARCRISIFVKPCNGRTACRELAEVYISSGEQQLSVRTHGSSLLVTLYFQEVWTEMSVGSQQTMRFGIGVDFKESGFISITVIDGLTIDVTLYANMMSVVLYIPENIETGPDSLLGSWDFNWLNDINVGYPSAGNDLDWLPINSTYFQESVYSQEYINSFIAKFYRIAVDEVNFQHPMAAAFTSGSFMLRFQNGMLTFIDLPLLVLNQFSLQFWIRVHDTTRAHQTVLTWHSRSLVVHLEKTNIVVTINNRVIRTTLSLSSDVWFHLVVTWRNYDGRLILYLYNSNIDLTSTFLVFGVSTAQHLELPQTLSIGQSSNDQGTSLGGDIDQIILQNKHINDAIAKKMRDIYTDELSEDIVLAIPLQEGIGNETISRGQNGSQFVGRLEGLTVPQWMPSDAPFSILPDYAPDFIPEEFEKESFQICEMMFFEGPLYSNCRDLESTHHFYYESCLEDIAATGNLKAGNISANMFAILCKEALNIPEVQLCGFYNYCRYESSSLLWWWWILLLILLILLILITIGVCFYRKFQKNHPGGRSDGTVMSAKETDTDQGPCQGVSSSSGFVFGEQANDDSRNIKDLLVKNSEAKYDIEMSAIKTDKDGDFVFAGPSYADSQHTDESEDDFLH